ncbi:uncharacterized protein LOC135500887 isoform X2 [Lineus longissimus]|uniref:uncharacterized protein LOC135500887 isoform X2 n=1 Tax=Lineus longissimus TaxID=88925 RepID=UPI00315C8CAE
MSVTGSIASSATSHRKRSSVDVTRNGDLNHSVPTGEESDDEPANIDHDIVLDVVLPDGTTRQMTVNYNIPMMDLLVHAAASSRLSPVGHIVVVRDTNGHVKEYRPNQSIGSLGVDAVYLQQKGVKMEKTPSKSNVQPFEITNRLIINLPKSQKMVLRVSLQTKLSEIFTIICSEKGLDSFIHELRHPKNHDMELNLDKSLQDYGLTEVNVVNIKAPQSSRGSDDDYSIHSPNASEILPPSIHVPVSRMSLSMTSSGHSGHTGRSASPEKKKKGLKGLFKKKEKKAPKGSSHHFSPPPAPAQDSNFILRRREPNKGHDPSHRHTMPPEAFMGDVWKSPDLHNQQSPTSTLNRTKKRHAPAPPPGGVKTNIDGSAEIVTSEVGPMHQASLGTRQTGGHNQVSASASLSPLSASSGVSGSVDFKNEKRSQSVHDIPGAGKEVGRPMRLDVATAGSVVVNSLKVVKKKRRAPAPPESPTTPTQNGDIAGPSKPPRAISMYVEPTSLNVDVNKSRRPCSFIAPPPPDTPPPEDVPIVSLNNGMVTKSVSTSFNPDVEIDQEVDVQVNGDAHHVDDIHVDITGHLPSDDGEIDANIEGDKSIDDVNLAFENVIAEAEKVMEDDEVYTHQSEMARFVNSMRGEAEDRAKTGVEIDAEFEDDISIELASESDTVINHGSEPQSEVSSNLDASGHMSMSFNAESSLESPKVAVGESDIEVEDTIMAQVVTHEETAPNFSLDNHDVSNMDDHDTSNIDDHSEDVLANSNVTADSGLSQSYDRHADHFIEEIDSAFDTINFDLETDKTVPTKSVGAHHTNLTVDTELEMRDDLSKGTVSDIDTPPVGKGVEILETEYDGDVSADNGAIDVVMVTTGVEKNDHFESEPATPRRVISAAGVESPIIVDRESSRVESPIMVDMETPRVESPNMVTVGVDLKASSHIAHDSSPELIKRHVLESTPKDVVIHSKPKDTISNSFGVMLRHTEPESNVVFETGQDYPSSKAGEAMVNVRTNERKVERVSIVKPAEVRDSKVFTIGKDEEMFDFEKIRQRALAAQKEKSSGSKKHYGVAGSRPKSEVQKQTAEISFKPNGEGEAEHVLEEKSIMMMSRPKEMKSVEVKVHEPDVLRPKMVVPDPEPQPVKVKSIATIKLGTSSMKDRQKPEMVEIGAQSSYKKAQQENLRIKTKSDVVDMNIRAIPTPKLPRDEVEVRAKSHHAETETKRPMSLSALMAAHLPPKFENDEKQPPQPIKKESENSTAAKEDDPEIQNQMDMLQAQFSDFQKQFQANQSLLSKQKILGREQLPDDSRLVTSQPPDSPSSVGSVEVTKVPIPPPFIIKGEVKPVRKTAPKKFEKDLEPREELMIAIRNVGGRNALRKTLLPL